MFNLTSNNNNNQAQGQNSQNPRFYPANPSLNKNADGFVVSINMQTSDYSKGTFESRIEYFKQGKPQVNKPLLATGFSSQPQQAPLFGSQQGQQGQGNLGGLFQGAQGGGLFQQNPQTIPLGGPQITPNNQLPSFNLQNPNQNQGGLFGQSQQTALGGGGLFNGQLGSAGGGLQLGQQQGNPQQAFQQNQQPLSGGLFGTQQTQGGLFNTQAQAPLNFGSFAPQGQIQQQQPLFAPQGQFPMVGGQQMAYPNQQQMSQNPYIQQGQPDEQVAERDQQEYLKEMEEKFNNDVHLMGLNQSSNSYSIKIHPNSKNIGISISKDKSSAQRYQSRQTLIQSPANSLNQQSQSRYQVRSKYNPQMVKPLVVDQARLSSVSSKLKQIPKRTFYVQCSDFKQNVKIPLSLDDLSLQGVDLRQVTVQRFVNLIQEKVFLQRQIEIGEKQYQAMYQILGQSTLEALTNDVTLEDLQLQQNSVIVLIPTFLSRSEKNSKLQSNLQQKQENINAPQLVCNNERFFVDPPIEELRFLDDDQLTCVQGFTITTQFAKVEFLQPVDLTRLQIDRVVLFSQDSVEFYPEDDGFETPEQGRGLNVPCRIEFYNFGDGQEQMKKLKQQDFDEFVRKVVHWAESLDMQIIQLKKGENFIVELNGV